MKYGLIGEKLAHSYSPKIHSFFGNESYELVELNREQLEGFLQKKDFKGINVTIPYKQEVMRHCKLSKQARDIGAVNTIVNRNGVLYGYNTDYFGFATLAKRAGIDFGGKKVLVLGNGGTCLTACAVVRDEGAKEIVVVSRKGENTYENISKHYDAQVIINTTPVGMYPNNEGSIVDLGEFKCLSGVIDVIYNPLKTKLILQAQELGIKSVGGLGMLVAQALYAHNLFFGTEGMELLDESIKKAEKIFTNVVLVGMPGVGKSTIAKLIAQKYELKYVDTDEVILQTTLKSSADLIKEQGEQAFRKIEAEVLEKICKSTGQVIATGGGGVLLRENRIVMRQNGKVFYIRRNLGELSTKNRPLSTDLEKLYKKRNPLYQEVANHVIEASNDASVTLQMFEKFL